MTFCKNKYQIEESAMECLKMRLSGWSDADLERVYKMPVGAAEMLVRSLDPGVAREITKEALAARALAAEVARLRELECQIPAESEYFRAEEKHRHPWKKERGQINKTLVTAISRAIRSKVQPIGCSKTLRAKPSSSEVLSDSQKQAGLLQDRVALIFDDQTIDRLAMIAKFSSSYDREKFSRGLRTAAYFYLEANPGPLQGRINATKRQRSEIEALYRAAVARNHDAIAKMLTSLSPETRYLIDFRPGGLQLMEAAVLDFQNIDLRDHACASIEKLVAFGGRWKVSRDRPQGRWEPYWLGADPKRNFAKRESEYEFLQVLGAAWLHTTGKSPPRTANPQMPSAFARLAAECFLILGVKGVNVAELINVQGRPAKRPSKEK